jgi:hypothetical protein
MHTGITIIGILIAIAGAVLGLGAVAGNFVYFYDGEVSVPLMVLVAIAVGLIVSGVGIALYGYRRASLFTKRLFKAAALVPWSLTSLWLGLGIIGVVTRFNLWGASLFNDSFEYPIAGWCFAFAGVVGLCLVWRSFTERPHTA